MEQKIDISVVVPLYNEEESLPELVAWIDRVAKANNLTYEVIMVDDGSTDGSWSVVERLKGDYPAILKFAIIFKSERRSLNHKFENFCSAKSLGRASLKVSGKESTHQCRRHGFNH